MCRRTMKGFSLALAGLVVFAMTALSGADESKPQAPAQEPKGEEVEIKVEKVKLASPINFMAEFEMDLDSLIGLGARIDQARYRDDVVELAAAARVLAALEHASGKKAPLTAKDLGKEVVTLAKLRNRSDELVIVAALMGDAKVTKEFEQLAAKAKIGEEEELAAAEAGEQTRHIGTLHVTNPTDGIFRLWAGGRFLGVIYPGGHEHYLQVHGRVLHAKDHYGHHVHFHLPPHAAHFTVRLHQGHHH